MESSGKFVVIAVCIASFLSSCWVMAVYVAPLGGWMTAVPAAAGQIIALYILKILLDTIKFDAFRLTFAAFDRRAYLFLTLGIVQIFIETVSSFAKKMEEWQFYGAAIELLLLLPFLLSMAGLALIMAFSVAYLLAAMLIYLMLLALAYLADTARYEIRTGRCVCPNCLAIFRRPIYLCYCGQEYPSGSTASLRPSIHGLKRMNCGHCIYSVPVDRNRRFLDAICPECRSAIST